MTWLVSMYVCKYVCMKVCLFETLSSFHLYLLNHALKLNQTLQNINIRYAVILPLHDFHLRGQTKVTYIKICYKTLSFICISRSIYLSLTKLCMNVILGVPSFYLFYDFYLRGQTNVAYV